MERRNRRRSASTVDELSLVKAAAWAWYQHGSGSEGKVVHEFIGTTRIRHAPKPSRYKLEAIKFQTRKKEAEASRKSCNTLLDPYEVERISKQLDILIEYGRRHSQKVLPSPSSDDDDSNELPETNTTNKKKIKKKKKKQQGPFWFWRGIAGCSSRVEDVLNTLVPVCLNSKQFSL